MKKKNSNPLIKCYTGGFTLIELLVVVLIIGILAAIAFPQYQKAVFKTKFMSVLPIVKAVKEAEELYYMANGVYTTNLENLDLNLTPDNPGGAVKSWWENPGKSWTKKGLNIQWAVSHNVVVGSYGDNINGCAWSYHLDKHSTRGGELWCAQLSGNSIHPWCQKLCESMGYPYRRWSA